MTGVSLVGRFVPLGRTDRPIGKVGLGRADISAPRFAATVSFGKIS
jgi:hypothetical protein